MQSSHNVICTIKRLRMGLPMQAKANLRTQDQRPTRQPLLPMHIRRCTGLHLDFAQVLRAVPAPLSPGTARRPLAICSIMASCKGAELLADFVTYLHASAQTGKGNGKALTCGFCCPATPPTCRVFSSTGEAPPPPIEDRGRNVLHKDRRGLSEALVYQFQLPRFL